MSLTAFRTLGRSGLVVSPLALGTMTFGTPRWGSPDEVSGAIFDAYVEAGGNFVDTAEGYSGGGSEELLGALIRKRSLRDGMVIATKFTTGYQGYKGHDKIIQSNFGGNNAKGMRLSVEASLRKLQTN